MFCMQPTHRLCGSALSYVMIFTALCMSACHGSENVKEEKAGTNPKIVIKTSMGTIKAELFADKAPTTVKNFLAYVDAKHYDETVFHRVISTFMIQGGGFKKGVSKVKSDEEFVGLEKSTKAGIRNEADNGLNNKRGTLAMARTGDPHSATAQFFINVVDNAGLDHTSKTPAGWGYTVFGRVTEGLDVVDKIRAVKTGRPTRSFADVPVEDVVIESIRRE